MNFNRFTMVICGTTGVGKSTLINRLFNEPTLSLTRTKNSFGSTTYAPMHIKHGPKFMETIKEQAAKKNNTPIITYCNLSKYIENNYNYIDIYDMPGFGEHGTTEIQYLIDHKNIFKQANIVYYVMDYDSLFHNHSYNIIKQLYEKYTNICKIRLIITKMDRNEYWITSKNDCENGILAEYIKNSDYYKLLKCSELIFVSCKDTSMSDMDIIWRKINKDINYYEHLRLAKELLEKITQQQQNETECMIPLNMLCSTLKTHMNNQFLHNMLDKNKYPEFMVEAWKTMPFSEILNVSSIFTKTPDLIRPLDYIYYDNLMNFNKINTTADRYAYFNNTDFWKMLKKQHYTNFGYGIYNFADYYPESMTKDIPYEDYIILPYTSDRYPNINFLEIKCQWIKLLPIKIIHITGVNKNNTTCKRLYLYNNDK